jgi:hypothetical protein
MNGVAGRRLYFERPEACGSSETEQHQAGRAQPAKGMHERGLAGTAPQVRVVHEAREQAAEPPVCTARLATQGPIRFEIGGEGDVRGHTLELAGIDHH